MSGGAAGGDRGAEPVTVVAMMGLKSHNPDWVDALGAYVQACLRADAKRMEYESAERIASEREDEMRVVYERLTTEGADGG